MSSATAAPFPLTSDRPRVVILGGGFGGLSAAMRLRRTHMDVVLVDRRNHHLFQPLLYQVATAALNPGDVAVPFRNLFKPKDRVSLFLDEAVRVDRSTQHVHLKENGPLHYDWLIVATGNQPSYFGHDEWAEHAPGLKTIPDALNIRENLLLSFERAAIAKNPAERRKALTHVVIGGGPTGVEMAGTIAEIGNRTFRKDYPSLRNERLHVYLVEGADRVLLPYDPSLSQRAKEDLEELGVTVLLNTFVKEINEQGVQAGDNWIEAGNVIWGAGNAASSVVDSLAVETNGAGQAKVKPDLSLPDDPRVFVLGDAAEALGADGKPLPGVAQVALQQGDYIARNILKYGDDPQRPPFHYKDLGIMATIGRAKAVVQIGEKIKMGGFIAWVLWAVVHLWKIVTFRRRVKVFAEWIWLYLTFSPGTRLIYWRPGQRRTSVEALRADDKGQPEDAKTEAPPEAPPEETKEMA